MSPWPWSEDFWMTLIANFSLVDFFVLDVVDVALALERRLLDDFDCEFLLGRLLRALVGDAKRAASEFLAHVVVRRKVRGISKHVTDLHTSRRRCRVRGAGGARIGRGHTIPHPLAAAFDLKG